MHEQSVWKQGGAIILPYFFLPIAAVAGGQVTSICVYGYPRVEHEEHITREDGHLDLRTIVLLFVYVVLYGPINEAQTL